MQTYAHTQALCSFEIPVLIKKHTQTRHSSFQLKSLALNTMFYIIQVDCTSLCGNLQQLDPIQGEKNTFVPFST